MHFLCHLDKYTFVPSQKTVAQKRTRQTVWLDSSTEKLGHNPPKRQKQSKSVKKKRLTKTVNTINKTTGPDVVGSYHGFSPARGTT